ncbi:MAG: hypothetical protein KJ050_14675 [Candidatus Omnitrophica bacterium]|nr:hypothetical protein [Candidatus Omnitrophota bacterium]MCL4736173.1 hypothetical protein [Candidatus Omnitrophota bacterium]
MVRGVVVCLMLMAMVLAAPVSAGFVPDGKELISTGVGTSKVEVLLPPGADLTDARGSLIVERLPFTERLMADGSVTRTMPVQYTFVNHWHETFMFDGFNEAVLTDAVGEKHFATSVLREGEPLLTGVTGLIPHGGMTTFTLFYDLPAGADEASFAAMQLDLRYLNHGHPFVLSTLISSEPGVEERPNVVEIAPPPVAPVPEPVAPAPVIPEPVVVKEQPAPPPVVPMPEPPAIAEAPAPILPPPVIAQQPVETPPPPPPPAAPNVLPVNFAPCAPCAPCRPVCNPCNLLAPLCKLPLCLLNVVCKGAQCLTCVTAKGVCDITCGTCSAAKCMLGAVCNPFCNICAPCSPCGPQMVAGQ